MYHACWAVSSKAPVQYTYLYHAFLTLFMLLCPSSYTLTSCSSHIRVSYFLFLSANSCSLSIDSLSSLLLSLFVSLVSFFLSFFLPIFLSRFTFHLSFLLSLQSLSSLFIDQFLHVYFSLTSLIFVYFSLIFTYSLSCLTHAAMGFVGLHLTL